MTRRFKVKILLPIFFGLVSFAGASLANDAPKPAEHGGEAKDAHGGEAKDAHGAEAKDEHGAEAKDAHGAEAKDAHGGDGVGPASGKQPKPEVDCKKGRSDGANICPRMVAAPELEMQPIEPSRNEKWDYTEYRYSVIILMSSWNRRSEELTRVVRPYIPAFAKRHIGVLGYASHDSYAELLKWQDALRPGFPLGLAPIETIVREKNPKIPTVWIASSSGHLVTRLITPTDAELKDILEKLLLWTEF